MGSHKFIDLFAGCGGLSLGLSMAGMEGQFAVERDKMAFETFADNFLGNRNVPIGNFAWPSWLERRAWAIDDLLASHHDKLRQLRGSISLLAGGPPCQGFSFAGKRQVSDPRNMLFEKYVSVVDAIQPAALVLENVPGMKVAHSGPSCCATDTKDGRESFYEKLKTSLEAIDYVVSGKIIDASRFGVPQKRSRLIVIGLKNTIACNLAGGIERAFDILEEERQKQLKLFGLPEAISVDDAISDLRVDRTTRQECRDPSSPPGFTEAIYLGADTKYQKIMHKHCRNDAMDSMRLARHCEEVATRFEIILKQCARGVSMSQADRERFGLKKHRIHPMSSCEPAPTLTTLPDDLLHYAEPRILTVRESARLQSFPDWFRFKGKFTTGGSRRTKECPRYTQVGNAVPPLLGRAIGLALAAVIAEATKEDLPKPCIVHNPRLETVTIAAC